MNVSDKVAIVTGASSGVGVEVAVKLAALGAKVVINYARSRDGAEATLARIVEAGGQAVICQADVSDNSQCVALVKKAVDEYGQLDVLVNNAGTTTYVEHKQLDLLSDEIWQNTLGPLERGSKMPDSQIYCQSDGDSDVVGSPAPNGSGAC